MKINVLENWLDNVAYSHSKSASTEQNYGRYMTFFCDFLGKTPEQILEEYEGMSERKFRRKYARYVRALIARLTNEGYAVGSIRAMVTAIRSFFKYNDLPLGHVPLRRVKATFHNRDITRREIQEILKISRPREKAFFCMMTQSGLRPHELTQLRLKNIEPDFSDGVIPCKIEVPSELAKGEFGAYFTFMGQESVEYLRAYLLKRINADPEHHLFTSHGTNKPLDRTSVSHIFRKAVLALKQKGTMDFNQKAKGKPSDVRLYNLRKFFRNSAGQAGDEYVNFWMGHKANYKAPHIPASDVHYFSRENVEFQRQLYAEKAMPYLRLETATPTETEKTIMELRSELGALRRDYTTLKKKYEVLSEFKHEFWKTIERVEQTEREYWDKVAKLERRLENLKTSYNQSKSLEEMQKGIEVMKKEYGPEWLESKLREIVFDVMTEYERKKFIEEATKTFSKLKRKTEE